MANPLPTVQAVAPPTYHIAGYTITAEMVGTIVIGLAVVTLLAAAGYVAWKAWKEGKLRFPFFAKWPILTLAFRRRTGGQYHTDLTFMRKIFNKLGTISYEFKQSGEKLPRTSYAAIQSTSPQAFIALEEYEAGEYHPIMVRRLDQFSAQCRNCGAYYIGRVVDLPEKGMPPCRDCKRTYFTDPDTGKQVNALTLRHSLLELETRVDKEMSLAIASEAANLNENYENKEWWQVLSGQIILGIMGVVLVMMLYVAFTNGSVYADAATAQANAARELGGAIINATKELYIARTGIVPTTLPLAH